jgi:hypothetical protein
MAVSINIATFLLLQVSLLLFSASHVQFAHKIPAQTIHNHDNDNCIHDDDDVRSTGHKDFTPAPTMSSPHLEMVKDTDGDEESCINNSSSMITADLLANAAPLLLPNSFTCPQAFFLFRDSLTNIGNIQILAHGLPNTTLQYPYGESYTFTNEPGHNRYCDGKLIIDFICKFHEFTVRFHFQK